MTCFSKANIPLAASGFKGLLRNLRVKCKMSGGFRSEVRARVYSQVRSVIEAAIQLEVDVQKTISNLDVLVPRLALGE